MDGSSRHAPDMRDGRGRPLLEPGLRRLLRQLTESAPTDLGHVDIDRVALVAGAARRSARASIRPLRFADGAFEAPNGRRKPQIDIRGRAMLYELCLRPLFFLRTEPDERLRILVHELWHISPLFDGTLDPNRRHRPSNRLESQAFAERVAAAARHRLDTRVLSHEGELRAPMWLERPPSLLPPGDQERMSYGERDLFLGVVEQRTSGGVHRDS